MKRQLLLITFALVRCWTRVYTWGLSAARRERRRAEIESDLWELEHDDGDEDRHGPAFQAMVRLIMGMPADLLWRTASGDRDSGRLHAALVVAASAAITLSWIVAPLPPLEPPPPPDRPAPILSATAKPLRVPQAPPPPAAPPRSERRDGSRSTLPAR